MKKATERGLASSTQLSSSSTSHLSVGPASPFSVSSPITSIVTNSVVAPLSRVASSPGHGHAVMGVMPSPASSSSYSPSTIVYSTSSSSSSSSTSSSRSSSRPSSPSSSSSRRFSQPFLLPTSSTSSTPSMTSPVPPVSYTTHNGASLMNQLPPSSSSVAPFGLLSHRYSVPSLVTPFTPLPLSSTAPSPPLQVSIPLSSFPTPPSQLSAPPASTPSLTRTLSSPHDSHSSSFNLPLPSSSTFTSGSASSNSASSPSLFLPQQPLSRLS
jgi:hypothetical protein